MGATAGVYTKQMTSSSAVSGAIIAATSGFLARECFDLVISAYKSAKVAPILMFLQCLFCFFRSITLVIGVTSTEVNCLLLGNLGMGIYALWIGLLDATLLVRSSAFFKIFKWDGNEKYFNETTHKVFMGFCSLQIAFSVGVQIYVATSAFTIDIPGKSLN